MLLRKKLLAAVAILCLTVAGFIAFILPSQYTVPILMYHHIKQSGANDRLSVSPDNFKKQMDFLSKQKYRVISLEELVRYLKSQKPLPHNLVVITIDDGYEDNYLYAFPPLKNNNFSAEIFLITDSIGHEGYLNWKEIQEMAANRIDFGSHTKSHAWLGSLEDIQLLHEQILESKIFLEAKLNRPVNFFCYPGGGINALAKQVVVESGYLGACATHPGDKYAKYDIYALSRIKISSTDNLFTFWIKTSGYYTLFKEKK